MFYGRDPANRYEHALLNEVVRTRFRRRVHPEQGCRAGCLARERPAARQAKAPVAPRDVEVTSRAERSCSVSELKQTLGGSGYTVYGLLKKDEKG